MRIEICVQSFPTCNVLAMLISHSSVSCNKKHCSSSTTQFHRLTYNRLKYSKDGRLHLKMKLMPKTLSWGVSLYLLLVRAFSLCNEWDSFDSFSTLVGMTYLFYQTCVLINSTFFRFADFVGTRFEPRAAASVLPVVPLTLKIRQISSLWQSRSWPK